MQYQWHKHTRTRRRKDEIKIIVYYTILTNRRGGELMIHRYTLYHQPSGCFTLLTEPSVDTSVTRATRPLYFLTICYYDARGEENPFAFGQRANDKVKVTYTHRVYHTLFKK